MGRRERERNRERRAAEADGQAETEGAAGGDSGGAPPLVRQVIPGRPLIDVGTDAVLILGTADDDDFDEDDDGEDDDEELDDVAILEEIRDRVYHDQGAGREWTEIAATLESLTVAVEVLSTYGTATKGCLVRVIAWGLDGAEHHTTTWIPDVSVEDLQRIPEGST